VWTTPQEISLPRRLSVSIEEQVINVVAEQLAVDKEKITRETSFVNDLGADSLDTVELIMELEEEFDLMIPESEAEKIQTVGQAIDFIEDESGSDDAADGLTEEAPAKTEEAPADTEEAPADTGLTEEAKEGDGGG